MMHLSAHIVRGLGPVVLVALQAFLQLTGEFLAILFGLVTNITVDLC